ncbi:hypothetical protein BU23DRAFT_552123 [Bimuria novae-zelandiae CBS 107.79]|uniref:Uncharacterized protein n=1 Tax=Bimuria novae-zelandiae CBS 107.79 TaxID=1447943 RepID=A0A6A5VGF0_9PLEO|nr:hypothetical protein BU23DRAFT_552123 [Bimuria novae-zelandiae CBS 107.79]
MRWPMSCAWSLHWITCKTRTSHGRLRHSTGCDGQHRNVHGYIKGEKLPSGSFRTPSHIYTTTHFKAHHPTLQVFAKPTNQPVKPIFYTSFGNSVSSTLFNLLSNRITPPNNPTDTTMGCNIFHSRKHVAGIPWGEAPARKVSTAPSTRTSASASRGRLSVPESRARSRSRPASMDVIGNRGTSIGGGGY